MEDYQGTMESKNKSSPPQDCALGLGGEARKSVGPKQVLNDHGAELAKTSKEAEGSVKTDSLIRR